MLFRSSTTPRGSAEEGEDGRVDGQALPAKPRAKRQMLLSDSESETEWKDGERKDLKSSAAVTRGKDQSESGSLSKHYLSTKAAKTQRAVGKRERESPAKEEPRKRPAQPSREASPPKKLRLVDIDFTGGRMNQSLLPLRHQGRAGGGHKPKPARPASGGGRTGGADGRVVPGNASNILKSTKPIRPVSSSAKKPSSSPFSSYHPSLPSSASFLPQPKRPLQDSGRSPLALKDAVLAAKFPQKRKLLSEPTTSSLSPSPSLSPSSSSSTKLHRSSKAKSHRPMS